MKLKDIALSITAIAGMAAATVAAADNSYFELERQLDNSTTLELGLVSSEGDGVIEIYTYHKDQIGTLLGTEEVHAGANRDVHVNLSRPANVDVIALLKVDGETVASRDYIIVD